MKYLTKPLLGLTSLIVFGWPAIADEPKKKPAKPYTRLFIQDHKSSSLKWTTLRMDDEQKFRLDSLDPIDGMKALDPAKQKFVQMKESQGMICAGVRDEEDGKFESGWMLIRSGVTYTDHGDHGHWSFKNKPSVEDSRLDKSQGNPAHLYQYDGRFFLANDKLNGYTRIDPKKYDGGLKDTPRFLIGGGNHITLAVVDDKVGYSAWVDGGGPNKGRVDVTPVTDQAKIESKYSFTLPSGGIHGAIANSGKVFFAPVDGVCWVQADLTTSMKPDQVKVNHISLGMDGEKPRRTGSFHALGHHVIFTTGKESCGLVLVNAKEAEPKPVILPLQLPKGTQLVMGDVCKTAGGQAYAFVFHDRNKDAADDVTEALEIIALDPNGDGDFSDAKIAKRISIGKSAAVGHSGHHAIAFDTEKRIAIITNPADGNLTVINLKTLDVAGTFSIGGFPTAILAVGSRDVED